MKFLEALSFPLFSKDLAERAARPRTYIARGVFGLLLTVWYVMAMREIHGDGEQGAFSLLGIGNALLSRLARVTCWSIVLIQPVILAGVLTYEKERSSLELLLLTDTSPMKLLIEKYLAGLVPMATLLLFSLPLAAVSYAYGGVVPETAWSLGFVILAAWLQTGAFALMCSAWCRTTAGAIIASYALLSLFYVGTETVLSGRFLQGQSSIAWALAGELESRESFSYARGGFDKVGVVHASVFPLRGVDIALSGEYGAALKSAVWMSASALVSLLIARLFLLRRAMPSPKRRLGHWFALRSEEAVTKSGTKDAESAFLVDSWLLTKSPIQWLEARRSVLGNRRTLARASALFLQVALPLILLLGIVVEKSNAHRIVSFFVEASVAIGLLCVLVQASGTFARERANQSLDILLTTPIRCYAIVWQKCRATSRLSLAIIAGVGVLAAMRFFLRGWVWKVPLEGLDRMHFGPASVPTYVCVAAASLFVLFFQARWIATWTGLYFPIRTRAILAALGVYAALILLPPYIAGFWPGHWRTIGLLDPTQILSLNERGNLLFLQTPLDATVTQADTILRVALTLIFHGSIGIAFQVMALRNADLYLRRNT